MKGISPAVQYIPSIQNFHHLLVTSPPFKISKRSKRLNTINLKCSVFPIPHKIKKKLIGRKIRFKFLNLAINLGLPCE
jgi:hypothetical protein